MSLQRKRRSCSCLLFQFKTDKNLGNRACKQIANAFVTVDTSLWPVTLWYFFGKFCCSQDDFQTIMILYLFPEYDIYAAHVLLALNRWPLNLVSTSQSASLFTCSKLVKATIKPKPQAKVNSPCWWHLGWWPCQRWRRGILWAHHRGCLRAGRIPPLNCSNNTDELLFFYAFRESE